MQRALDHDQRLEPGMSGIALEACVCIEESRWGEDNTHRVRSSTALRGRSCGLQRAPGWAVMVNRDPAKGYAPCRDNDSPSQTAGGPAII